MAYDLTEADLPAATRAKVDKMWRGMAAGYLDAMDAKPKNFNTNWQSHRVKLAAMAAFQTGDAKLIDRARAAFRARSSTNIQPDGSVFDFHERDALHYVTYDLDPLMMAALSAKAHGEDWLNWKSDNGVSLVAAARLADPLRARPEDPHRVRQLQDPVRPRPRRRRPEGIRAPSVGRVERGGHLWPGHSARPRYRAVLDEVSAKTGRKPAAWIRLREVTLEGPSRSSGAAISG